MTTFENKTFRELVWMKSAELEKDETEESLKLAEELRQIVKEIYGYQKTREKEEV